MNTAAGYRLELNAAGSWKLLSRFEGFTTEDRAAVLHAGALLVDALALAGSPGLKLRAATDEPYPRALTYYSYERGWHPKNPIEAME